MLSSYREQVYHLYGRNPVRFPCESPFIERNFYAAVDKEDLQRQILGYIKEHKSVYLAPFVHLDTKHVQAACS